MAFRHVKAMIVLIEASLPRAFWPLLKCFISFSSDNDRCIRPPPDPYVHSGIGGFGSAARARVLMPDRRFVYVADDAAFP